jgi:nicotinamidase/pyrazinamidase
MKSINCKESGLLVVDAQCGFTELCPEELPVPGGLAIVPFVNELLQQPWQRIDASQDWHPPDHRSFFGGADNLYPPHCIAGTRGAEFIPGIDARRFHAVWRKGYDRDFEAYAVTAQHPGFPACLRGGGVNTVVLCGLALNICCFFAARDLRRSGFRVLLVEDASAGIDIAAAGLFQSQARQEGRENGIEYVSTRRVLDAIG